jgi:hypothetical protein
MALTYEVISNTVLSSRTGTVTFSSIPQTYYDLIIRINAQGIASGWNYINLRCNGDTSTNYSYADLNSDATTVVSSSNSGQTSARLSVNSVPNISYSTGSQIEYYMGGYTSVAKIPILGIAMGSRASTTQYSAQDAATFRGNGPVTSITLLNLSSDFEVGSSFRLYGVRL